MQPIPSGGSKPWLRGAIISASGVLVGTLSLVLFCYALGLNLQDEGWPEERQINGTLLATSLVGFAAAILVFWLGFFQTTDSKS